MSVDRLAPLTIVLARHGVTDMTTTHQFSGSDVPGPGLNAAGRVQAARAADAVYNIGRRTWKHLPRVSRVLASPMTRTHETAGALARRLGVHVEPEERLREVAFGRWEGLTAEQIRREDGEMLDRWRHGEGSAPGGESLSEVGVRLGAVLGDLAREHAALAAAGDERERAWAAASHAVAIKCAVGRAFNIDRRSWGSLWPQPASLTVVQCGVTREGDIIDWHLLCLGAPTE